MAQTIFCSQCGAKLNPGAKFCHSCGTKISTAETENMQNKENVDNSVSHRLHEQYESIIYRKVIDAYCEDDEIAMSILYQNGVSYGFTHEMVDAVIKKQKEEINTFVNHLKDMYASDTMLIPDCSQNKENECVTFGENLGFCEEDAYEIYKAFMRQNKLEDKFFIITAQLAKYEHEGVVSDFNSIPECKNLDSDRFYIRFVKAIDKLREYQQSLHENSHSDSLNENDIQKIRKKAIELGFYDFFADADSDIDEDTDSLIDEDIYVIDMLITGNEVNLGFAAKANEKMFSAVIPFRTVTLLGKKVCFESSYFLNEYLKNTFFQHFNCQAKKLTDVLQEVAEHINHPQAIDVIDNCGKIIESIWKKSFVALQDSLPLDRPTKDKLYQAVRERIDTEHLGVVDWELKQCSILFEEIDENVNDVKLEGKISQMCRGRWSGGGYGLSGAVKGAVAATVLDAGTGLLYSVANSISVSKAKSKSEKRKIEVFQSTLNFLDMVLKALPKETIHCTYMFLRNQYTFSNSYSEEKGDKVYELYSKEKNEQRKNELALELIKINPYNQKYYLPLLEQIFKENADSVDNDAAALCKISEWFEIDLAKEKQDFESDTKKAIFQEYSKDDIKRCEMIFKLESVLGYQTDTHNSVLREYLISNKKMQLEKYTIDELYAIANELKSFEEKFSYPAEKLIFSKLEKYVQHCLESNLSMSPDDLQKLLCEADTFCQKHPELKQNTEELRKNILGEYMACSTSLNIVKYTADELYTVTDTITTFCKMFSYSAEEFIAERVNQYIEYHIKHDLKGYTPENINTCCKNIDLLNSKFSNFSEVLNNAKEQIVKKVFSHYKIKLNSNDKQQTEHNIEKLTYLTDSCLWDFSGYLRKETERLQTINYDADIKSRTAYGVLYDSVKEANEARKEMDALTNMTKDNAELSMASRLFKIMQYNFKTNQAQSEIDERSKELMNHIENLRNSVHRKSSALRFFLSLLATPIIACIGLAFSIPGIVIALIVIAAIWSVYHETRKECKAYNKEAAKKKQEIKEFENLFIVKNNRLIIKK